MFKSGVTLEFSASDLVGHLNCRYLTKLDLDAVNGLIDKPQAPDPFRDLLAERGALHETAFVTHLRETGLSITVVEGSGVDASAVSKTLDAMKSGVAIIAQAALGASPWNGRADILRRVEEQSGLGAWSYEVIDTKLARETKGNTVLQICLYSDLLGIAQEKMPEFAYVVAPGKGFAPQSYRFADYGAYYRRVKASLERAVIAPEPIATYPEPIEHCDICRWRIHCEQRRRDDDHLSLVAGISKSQRRELEQRGIATMNALAAVPLPLPWKPVRGAVPSYERAREQARLQVAGKNAGEVVYEPLPVLIGFGFSKLPAPSPGDIFVDLEGDPFVEDGGIEFLFGYAWIGDAGHVEYQGDWALSRAQEKATFERFIDFAWERWKAHPDLHIYHFAPYEPAALKRLMGRYVTREHELDELLRSEAFVDLYSIVRHSVRVSVESYSIKKLEPLYAFTRGVPLPESSRALIKVQAALELGDSDGVTEPDRVVVEGYNRDDCLSTHALRDWLESVRSALIASGTAVTRPAPATSEASENLTDWQQKIDRIVRRLVHDIPVDPKDHSAEQHARWLLAYTLDWHRREEKAVWWEYFRLRALSAEDLLDERAGLSGLSYLGNVGGTARAPIHRYQFPPQETDMRGGEDLRSLGGDRFGKVEAISFNDCTIDIKKRQDTAALHPDAVFMHELVPSQVLADSLVRLGEYVAEHGIIGEGPLRVARELLMAISPRLGDESLRLPDETALAAANRIARSLQQGVFPIQGPPGTGKTYIGARMICTFIEGSKTVGITANSHKVIRNILDEVIRAAAERSLPLQCIQKVSEKEANLPQLQFTTDNGELLGAIGPTAQVAAGTAWLWARPDATDAVDVLVVDEAAQMSLANVLAVSQAGSAIVLLGDPRQLEQPIQGSHPDGVDASALKHILGDHATIPQDRGLFLEETWRLHPNICAFTSEVFYDGRLRPREGLENQCIPDGAMGGAALRFLPIVHQGNQSSSPEEADKILDLVNTLLRSNARWIDREANERPLTLSDILIIAPYNAQVFELQQRIAGARIGTVDKFQGQEAPIVIYSMTTSSAADAPRGMEFLFSPNRLNVATSRAKCLCIMVGSPLLFEAECRTPRQMQLVNAFCRYLEMAARFA